MRSAVSRLMLELNEEGFSTSLEASLREMGSGAGTGAASGLDAVPEPDEGVASEIFRSLAVESGAQGAESVAKTLEILHKLSVEADNLGAGGAGGAAAAGGPGGGLFGAAMGSMGGGAAGMSSDSAAAAEGLSDEVIARMMKEFEGMGAKEDFAGVVDNMMRQLLNRDIMYVPMRSVCEKFPEWLAKNAARQTREEYENYGKMYQTFQKLCMVYETEPDNFPRLLELMQDLQELGQPPNEIIKELAPGLVLSDDGLPVMPNVSARRSCRCRHCENRGAAERRGRSRSPSHPHPDFTAPPFSPPRFAFIPRRWGWAPWVPALATGSVLAWAALAARVACLAEDVALHSQRKATLGRRRPHPRPLWHPHSRAHSPHPHPRSRLHVPPQQRAHSHPLPHPHSYLHHSQSQSHSRPCSPARQQQPLRQRSHARPRCVHRLAPSQQCRAGSRAGAARAGAPQRPSASMNGRHLGI